MSWVTDPPHGRANLVEPPGPRAHLVIRPLTVEDARAPASLRPAGAKGRRPVGGLTVTRTTAGRGTAPLVVGRRRPGWRPVVLPVGFPAAALLPPGQEERPRSRFGAGQFGPGGSRARTLALLAGSAELLAEHENKQSGRKRGGGRGELCRQPAGLRTHRSGQQNPSDHRNDAREFQGRRLCERGPGNPAVPGHDLRHTVRRTFADSPRVSTPPGVFPWRWLGTRRSP